MFRSDPWRWCRASIGAVQGGRKKSLSSQMTGKQSQSGTSGHGKQSLVCFGYGKPGHGVYSAECTAKQATCGLCHRVGHFRAFCQSKSSTALVSGRSGGKHGASVLNKCLRLPTHTAGNVRATDSHVPKLAEAVYGTIELDCRNFSSKFTLKGRGGLRVTLHCCYPFSL